MASRLRRRRAAGEELEQISRRGVVEQHLEHPVRLEGLGPAPGEHRLLVGGQRCFDVAGVRRDLASELGAVVQREVRPLARSVIRAVSAGAQPSSSAATLARAARALGQSIAANHAAGRRKTT
jgi:hypothetical protein